MKIGIITDKNTEDAVVAESYENGGYLIIIETETMHAEAIIPNGGDGRNFTKEILGRSCEAIVCGRIQQEAFLAIADAQITRYNGYGLDIGTAAESAHYDLMPLIVTYEGGKTCHEEEHHESCECGVDEEAH